MKQRFGKKMRQRYAFRLTLCVLVAALGGGCWGCYLLEAVAGGPVVPGGFRSLPAALGLTGLVVFLAVWQYRLYRSHTRKVLFLLDAVENNDTSVHFNEEEADGPQGVVNRALNRMAQILAQVKAETVQREQYYGLILDCVSTGVVVLDDRGAVVQTNREALRLLGLEVFTHVQQLACIDAGLVAQVGPCRVGDKLQVTYPTERGTVQLAIRVSDIVIRQTHLRILALNDINNELDEKEIDSWMRLTRVLTHEIMNSVTPITSLSETLLTLVQSGAEPSTEVPVEGKGTDMPDAVSGVRVCEGKERETAEREAALMEGLQTIHATGEGLLAFVENYRRFTRIPKPEPSLFYVKEFLQRMVALARHQYPEARIDFRIAVVPDDLILYADEHLIGQVVINLLKNAIQAIESAPSSTPGRIRLDAACNEAEAVILRIRNNGPAIPVEVAEHIFTPFFTTREGGSGIGLPISRQIMRLSGGSLSLQTGCETTFVLQFD